MIEIACEHCGKKYRIKESKLANGPVTFKCNSCNKNFTVTGPDNNEQEQVSGAEPSEENAGAQDSMPAGNKKKVKFGLGLKVILVMLIVSLVPLGIFWGIFYKQASDQIRNDTVALMEQTADGLGSQVEEWIDKNVRMLQVAAELDDAVSMDRYRQEPLLKAISEKYPWIYLAFTVDRAGMNVARDDGNPLTDYSDRQYYKDVIDGKDVAWQTLIGRTSGKPALILAVPIKSGETVVGVMAAAMAIDKISKRIAQWRKGDTGFAFLVDEKGKVVAHQIQQYAETEKNLSDHPLVREYKKNQRPTTLSFKNDSNELVLGHAIGNPYGWTLGVQQNHDEVFASLQDVQRFAIILLLATVLFVIVIALISARRITSPIIRLTEATEKMSLGDFKVKIDVKSKDEIGNLAQAIARMQTSLRMAIERLRKR